MSSVPFLRKVRRRRGFSLLEIIVVLFILAMLLAIIIPLALHRGVKPEPLILQPIPVITPDPKPLVPVPLPPPPPAALEQPALPAPAAPVAP